MAVMGVIFGIYHSFRNPQISSDKKDALLDQRVQLEREQTEKRFSEFSSRLDSAFTLAQNHVHTVDTKVDALNVSVAKLSNEVTRLATIIEERIPKKH